MRASGSTGPDPFPSSPGAVGRLPCRLPPLRPRRLSRYGRPRRGAPATARPRRSPSARRCAAPPPPLPPARPSAAPGGPPATPAPRGVRVEPPWGVRVRGARPSPRREELEGWRRLGRRCPPSRGSGACSPRQQPLCWGAVSGRGCPLRVGVGLRVPWLRTPVARGGQPSRGRGSSLRSPPTVGATLLFGDGVGDELPWSEDATSRSWSLSPSLRLCSEKFPRFKASTSHSPGLTPSRARIVLGVTRSGLRSYFLGLGIGLWLVGCELWLVGCELCLDPDSAHLPPGVGFLSMSLPPRGPFGGALELPWVSGTWFSLGGTSQVPAFSTLLMISCCGQRQHPCV